MSNKRVRLCLVGLVLSLAVTGCANKGNRQAMGDSKTYAANTYGTGEMDAFDGSNLTSEQRNLLAQRKFLFGFDRYDLNNNDYESLTAHANYLKEHPNHKIRVEGHTDEQGSREYNIGLGERRGNAVSHFLASQGVPSNQYAVVSYGKEKPEIMGADEGSYAQNRRAVIVYEQ